MKRVAFYESLKMSLRSIASNKVRSFLTALGVMIGVAAVIALVALGNGARKSVEESLESLGSNLMLVYSGERRGGSLVRRNTTNIRPSLTEEDLELIRSFSPEYVTAAAPEASATGQVKYENVNAVASLVGTTTEYPEIRNFHPVHGDFFTAADVDGRRRVAVIGIEIYRSLFPEGDDPLGRQIRINGINYRIAGIMEEKGSSSSDTSVFIPISTFQRYVEGEREYALINITANSTEIMRELQRILEQEILRLHNLPNMDSADFYIANQLDILATRQDVTETFTILLVSIAAISLIVGGIGIMNIMLVSVTERTREIGVRMALGATAADIMRQFISEAVIISLLGGIAGIGLGIASSWGVSTFGGMASQLSLASIFLAFGFAFLIGLFFGGYPAYRASRLDPIDALRYE
ncbi:MAG: ABC transporter permease [Spirochaetia bacterium]|nr:ABC transporter permease [Spirochaetia bacterium]